MKRRHFLSAAGATVVSSSSSVFSRAADPNSGSRLGITIASYMGRWRKRGTAESGKPAWEDALDVLAHCQELGAGCLQIGVSKWTEDFAGKVRERREALGIELEGQIRLPWKDGDLARFEKDLLAAKVAGAKVIRSICLSGRRYEDFETLKEWNQFHAESKSALERAEPVLAKNKMRLGVENHKDWRFEEHVAILKHLDSEFIGATFDFGNNIALLEDPYEVAESLAPYLVSTHLKDMAMAEFDGGFLLSEVPLGAGILDLDRLITICRSANPDVWFNLEMITRDPLEVPVLSRKYWRTMDSLPAVDLAKTLALAKPGDARSLPRLSELAWEEQMALEEKHIRESFDYARAEMDFA